MTRILHRDVRRCVRRRDRVVEDRILVRRVRRAHRHHDHRVGRRLRPEIEDHVVRYPVRRRDRRVRTDRVRARANDVDRRRLLEGYAIRVAARCTDVANAVRIHPHPHYVTGITRPRRERNAADVHRRVRLLDTVRVPRAARDARQRRVHVRDLVVGDRQVLFVIELDTRIR